MVDPKSLYREKVSSPNIIIESNICTIKPHHNESFLRQKYLVEGLSARQIAVLIGCSHSAINSALKHLKLKKHDHPGGWVRYGFKMKAGRLITHVRQQMIIKKIATWHTAGWSYKKIADQLNKRHICTPTAKGKWHSTTVRRILRHQVQGDTR